MKYTLFAVFSLIVGQVALAQSMPAPKIGSCPYHTQSSGGACVPQSGHQVFYNPNRMAGCPVTWTSDGNYCVR